jgi:hypothetical protein
MSATSILEWRPLRRNSLLGFAKVELPSGLVISDVTILTGERGRWASQPMKDQGSKIRSSPLIEFTSKEIRDRWSAAVIVAMRAAHPEVFEDEHQ